MSSFESQLLDATAPWNDPVGFWAAYNAALASMFEQVYGLVSDQGDPEQTYVGVLDADLSTAGPISSLPVQNLTLSIPDATEITLISGLSVQTFTTAGAASAGWGAIPVLPDTPNFPYPLGTPVQLAYTPGWSALLDPENCPAEFLPFLAQFNGSDVPVGLDAAQARARILAEGAQHRGTLAAVTAAVVRNLTGTQSVSVMERLDPVGNPDAYWFLVIVRPDEVPNGDTQPIVDAVNAVKPGGVMWTLIQTDAWIISEMEASQPSLTALEAYFTTVQGLEEEKPGA